MNFKIELTPDNIELIGKMIDEQPFKLVAALARNIQAQIDAQIAASQLPDVMEIATAGTAKPKKGK